jgi:hypothetical protein
MDPFLAMAIAGAVPGVMNLINPPQTPPASPVNNINWGAMVPYQNQMLSSAFSPNSNLLNIALAKGGAGVNNSMVDRGLGGSSLADAALRQSNTDITNQWIQNQTQRQTQAYGAAMGGLGAQAGVANMQNQDAWNQYQQQIANKNGAAGGIGSIAGLIAGLASGRPSNGTTNTNGLYASPTTFTMPQIGGAGAGGDWSSYMMPGPNSGSGGNGY